MLLDGAPVPGSTVVMVPTKVLVRFIYPIHHYECTVACVLNASDC